MYIFPKHTYKNVKSIIKVSPTKYVHFGWKDTSSLEHVSTSSRLRRFIQWLDGASYEFNVS